MNKGLHLIQQSCSYILIEEPAQNWDAKAIRLDLLSSHSGRINDQVNDSVPAFGACYENV